MSSRMRSSLWIWLLFQSKDWNNKQWQVSQAYNLIRDNNWNCIHLPQLTRPHVRHVHKPLVVLQTSINIHTNTALLILHTLLSIKNKIPKKIFWPHAPFQESSMQLHNWIVNNLNDFNWQCLLTLLCIKYRLRKRINLLPLLWVNC